MAKSQTSSSPDLSALLLSLSHLVDRVGEGNLLLNLSVTDSQEVIFLRDQISALNLELVQLRERCRSLEYDYRCEVIVNMELQDLLKQNGISYRTALHSRHVAD